MRGRGRRLPWGRRAGRPCKSRRRHAPGGVGGVAAVHGGLERHLACAVAHRAPELQPLRRLNGGVGEGRGQRRLHTAVARAHGLAVVRTRGPFARHPSRLGLVGAGLRERTGRDVGVAVVPLARTLRERKADEPPAPRVVRPEQRRGRLTVERERPLSTVEAALRGPAPQRGGAARGVALAREREARPEQRLAQRQGLRGRGGAEAGRVMTEAVVDPPRAGPAGMAAGDAGQGERAAPPRAGVPGRIAHAGACPGPRSGGAAGGRIEVERPARERPPHPRRARRRHAVRNPVERLLGDGAPEPPEPRRRHRVVVHDGPHRHAVADGRAPRLREHHLERLRPLVVAVVVNPYPHLLLRLPRPERQVGAARRVVLPRLSRHRRRRPRRDIHPHRRGRGRSEPHRERHHREAGALLRRRVAHRQRRRRRRRVVVGHLDRRRGGRAHRVARAGLDRHDRRAVRLVHSVVHRGDGEHRLRRALGEDCGGRPLVRRRHVVAGPGLGHRERDRQGRRGGAVRGQREHRIAALGDRGRLRRNRHHRRRQVVVAEGDGARCGSAHRVAAAGLHRHAHRAVGLVRGVIGGRQRQRGAAGRGEGDGLRAGGDAVVAVGGDGDGHRERPRPGREWPSA